jgi:1,4-dihydroxy-2-naphthoyl-CoA synthase
MPHMPASSALSRSLEGRRAFMEKRKPVFRGK